MQIAEPSKKELVLAKPHRQVASPSDSSAGWQRLLKPMVRNRLPGRILTGISIMDNFALVTGANGLMGRHIVRELLTQSDWKIMLWLHARGEAEFTTKRVSLHEYFDHSNRFEFSWGDLCEDSAFCRLSDLSFTHIIHLLQLPASISSQKLRMRSTWRVPAGWATSPAVAPR